MRRYADPVEVRTTTTDEETSTPAAFLWRGRLYVVHDVLAHWCERRSWWSSPAASMVHGEGGVPEDPPGGRPGAGPRVADLAEELQVWRVSASPGRSFSGGVYDLCNEPAGTTSGSPGSPGGLWRLAHVAD
jgi:hypothetical protein